MKKNYCKYCGSELKKGNKYCTQCGKKIDDNSKGTFLASMNKKVLGSIVALIALLVVLLIMFFPTNNRKILKELSASREDSYFRFYKDAKANSRIYIQSQSPKPNENTIIDSIIVVSHGKMKRYNTNSGLEVNLDEAGIDYASVPTHIFSEIKNKSDKEIIALASEWDKESMEAIRKHLKDENESLISKIEDDQSSMTDEQLNIINQSVDIEDLYKTSKEILDLANSYTYEEPKFRKLEVKASIDDGDLVDEYLVMPNIESRVKTIFYNAEYDKFNSYAGLGDAPKLKRYKLLKTTSQTKIGDDTYSSIKLGSSYYLSTIGKHHILLDLGDESGLKDMSEASDIFNTHNAYITWE